MEKNWVSVGKIKDAFHLRGELYVLVFSGDHSWSDDLENCQIGSQVYKITKVRPHKDGVVIAVDGVNDRTQAETLKGKMFAIPEDCLVSEEGETIYLSEILDFNLTDSNSTHKGKIVDFSSNGLQDLLVVEKSDGSGQSEIPFVSELIVEIDFDTKTLEMKLPEGIWNLKDL